VQSTSLDFPSFVFSIASHREPSKTPLRLLQSVPVVSRTSNDTSAAFSRVFDETFSSIPLFSTEQVSLKNRFLFVFKYNS
jgi:hypothetical protein